MKKLLLTVSIASLVSACSTVPVSKYDSDIAKKESEIAALKQQLSSTPTSTAPVMSGSSDLFPPNPQPGHCYGRVIIPAEYTQKTESYLASEASEEIRVIPATYETVQERVLVQEASTRLETIPATYKTVTEQILVKQETSRFEVMPAVYETVTEQVLLQPAHTIWKKGSRFEGDALETSVDSGTGEIMCLVEVPASYQTITKRILVKEAQTSEISIPAEYRTISREVVDQPARTVEIEVPAVYDTVSITRMVDQAKEVRTEIPAVHASNSYRVKVTEEQIAWQEVLCEVNMTRDVVLQLQTELKDLGYYHNHLDSIWGADTQRALNNYAKKNDLPSGNHYVPLVTAEKLGIEL